MTLELWSLHAREDEAVRPVHHRGAYRVDTGGVSPGAADLQAGRPPMTTLLVSEIFPPRTGGSGRWFWEIYRRLTSQRILIAAGEHPHQDAFDRSQPLAIERLPLSLPSWGLAGLRG